MVVRILGEGQFDLEGEALHALKVADAKLFDAVAGGHEAEFHQAFHEVLRLVRERGAHLAAERLVESDLVLPASDTSLDEARKLFTAHPV